MMTDGGLIHRFMCKKTSLSTSFEQFLAAVPAMTREPYGTMVVDSSLRVPTVGSRLLK